MRLVVDIEKRLDQLTLELNEVSCCYTYSVFIRKSLYQIRLKLQEDSLGVREYPCGLWAVLTGSWLLKNNP